MNVDDAILSALRSGPPIEDRYVATPLLLDGAAVQSTGVRRLLPRQASRPTVAAGLQGVATGVAVLALLVGSFFAGRVTAPVAGPAARSSPTPLVQQAVVPYAVQQTYIRQEGDAGARWLVCPPSAGGACRNALPTILAREYWAEYNLPAHGFAAPATYWDQLDVATIGAGRLIVAAHLDPSRSIDARLFPVAAGPSAPQSLVPVSADPGMWFFDLGDVAPGRYVLGMYFDQLNAPETTFFAIGIVVI